MLLCAPSNKAADKLIEVLYEIAKCAAKDVPFRPIHIHAKKQQALEVQHQQVALHTAPFQPNPYSYDIDVIAQYHAIQCDLSCYSNHPTWGSYQDAIEKAVELKALKKSLENAFLSAYLPNIWVATCSFTIDELFALPTFTHVFVDEVAQAMPWEVLLAAMRLHCAKGQQLVLLGDRHQLPPTITMGGLAQKIAAKSIPTLMEEQQTVYNLRLNVCYRMVPELLYFVSLEFYGGSVHPASTVVSSSFLPNYFPMPSKKIPILFLAHNEMEDAPVGFSRVNTHEVDQIVALLQILLLHGLVPKQIGVLAGYQVQQIGISQKTQELHLPFTGANISTIDGYQGQERDIIILSCVRPTENRKSTTSDGRDIVGFMTDYRWVNVALSRSKQGLILVGNPGTLSHCPLWARYLKYLARNGLIHTNFLSAIKSHQLLQSPEEWYSDGSDMLVGNGWTRYQRSFLS